jgi:putative membrane protein
MFNRAVLVVAAAATLATSGFALAASSTAATSTAVSDAEKTFLTNAIQGDNSEIAMGGLALARGSTVAVRDYGFTLITDHRHDKINAEDVASRLGVTVPADVTPDAPAEMQKLMGLSGSAFDQEFASAMVMDHNKAIAMFEDAAKNKDTVGAYATKALPVLQKHLKTAQSLAGGASGNAASSASSAPVPAAPAPASSSAM